MLFEDSVLSKPFNGSLLVSNSTKVKIIEINFGSVLKQANSMLPSGNDDMSKSIPKLKENLIGNGTPAARIINSVYYLIHFEMHRRKDPICF